VGLESRGHRIAIFRPRLAEYVLNGIKKGAHVLVEGSLVSSTGEQANGKGKKAKTAPPSGQSREEFSF
jgi:single-stranded DNA-binding protein